MLSDNIKNSDPIHILSSEKRVSPNSVKKYYADNNLKNNIKFHYISSCFEEYLKRIEIILLKIENKASHLLNSYNASCKSMKSEEIIASNKGIIDVDSSVKFLEIFNKFESHEGCQEILCKFQIKFSNHFIKSKTLDAKQFLNTFRSLMKDHISSCAYEQKKFFLEENNYDEFIMYCLFKVFDILSKENSDNKLVSCPALETALKTKYQCIDQWIEDCTIKYRIVEDKKKAKKKLTKEEVKSINNTQCQNDTGSSFKSFRIPIESMDSYTETISIGIIEFANYLQWNAKIITKVEDVVDIINSIYKRKTKSMNFDEALKKIIKKDKSLASKTINTMKLLNLAEIKDGLISIEINIEEIMSINNPKYNLEELKNIINLTFYSIIN